MMKLVFLVILLGPIFLFGVEHSKKLKLLNPLASPNLSLQNKNNTASSKIERRTLLKQKYQSLEEQHMVVMVLAKQYNKELNLLRSAESLFCNYYDLDIDKWRKNYYVWDDVTGAFLERKIPSDSKKQKSKN